MSEESNISTKIFSQLNRLLAEKSVQADIIDHKLEKGLGNEQIIRELLNDFLPSRYGIAKGKVINSLGDMSKHCDVIIYDRLNCPKLFIDENNNQILPIEGVYCVFEVKTTLNRTILEQGFQNLLSVHNLLRTRINRSTNDFLYICPPNLEIIAFKDNRPLDKIENNFREMNEKYAVKDSFYSYSKKSPGFKEHTGKKYLVSSINILNKGSVYHMLDGSVAIGKWGEYTLGMLLTSLLDQLNEIRLPATDLINYFNYLMIENRGRERIVRRDPI